CPQIAWNLACSFQERGRRAPDDSAHTDSLTSAPLVLPARLGCDGLRRVRLGGVGVHPREEHRGAVFHRTRTTYEAGMPDGGAWVCRGVEGPGLYRDWRRAE